MSCLNYFSSTLPIPTVTNPAPGEYACLGVSEDGSIELTFDQWQNRWVNTPDGQIPCRLLMQELLNGAYATGTGTGISTVTEDTNAIYQKVQLNIWYSVYFPTLPLPYPDYGTTMPQTTISITQPPDAGTYFEYNSQGLQRIRGHFLYMFSRYFSTGSIRKVVLPGQYGYHPFMDNLFDACRQIPGACTPIQNIMCSDCSRTQVSSNYEILSLCGCVAPDVIDLYKINDYDASFAPQCDPLCNNNKAFQLINEGTDTSVSIGSQLICQSTVCVVDNVSISAASSTITGGVNFNQVCPACTVPGNTRPCVCIVDSTLPGILDRVNNGLNGFNQYCPGARCLSIQLDGTPVNVPCGSLSVPTTDPPVVYSTKIGTGFYIVIGVILIIAIISILCLWASSLKLKVLTFDGKTTAQRRYDRMVDFARAQKPAGSTSLIYR